MLRKVSLAAICLTLIGGLPASAAETVERIVTFEREMEAGRRISLDNLLGSMTIRGGEEGRRVVVEARIEAEAKTLHEAQSLADAVRLDVTEDAEGVLLHTVFPVDRYTEFRLPKSGILARWVTPVINRDSVAVPYDGRVVRVGNQRKATGLAVHLTVTLPMDVHSSFRQFVGSIHGSTSRGDMELEVIEGQILADHLYGSLQARAGGGQVEVSTFHGEELGVQTSAGQVALAQIETERARLTTGSGEIQISGITVEDLQVETSGGDITMDQLQPRVMRISTASGAIDLAPSFKHTEQASIHSGSGDVTLRVSEITSFDLLARTKSGSVRARDVDFEPIKPRDGAVGFRFGAGGPSVEVTADDGNVTVRAK